MGLGGTIKHDKFMKARLPWQLDFQRVNFTFVASWSINYTGFALESANSITAQAWEVVINQPITTTTGLNLLSAASLLLACSLALAKAGSNIAAKMAIIAITTNSSISVKPKPRPSTRSHEHEPHRLVASPNCFQDSRLFGNKNKFTVSI